MILQNFDVITGLILGFGIGFIILFLFILLALITVFLMVGLNAVKGRNREFGKVFVTSIINLLVGLIPCIGCVLEWVIINSRHETGFGNAIIAWLISIVLPVIILIVIVYFIFGGVYFGSILSSLI